MPGWKNFVLDKGFRAAAAVTKYRAVEFTGTASDGPIVGQVNAVTDVVCGIAQEEVTTAEQAKGKKVPVAMMGVSIVESGGALTVGQLCTTDNQGRAVAAVTGSRVLGIVVHGVDATGKQASVMLMVPGTLAP